MRPGRHQGLRLLRAEAGVSLETRSADRVLEDGWTVRESSSKGFDPDQMGRSTTPSGEISYPLLPIPISPTASPNRRYQYRLATLAVGSEEIALVTHLGMEVQIGSAPLVIPDAGFAPVTFRVRTPTWHFADGNVTYFLRYLAGPPDQQGPLPSQPQPNGVSDTFYGEGSALLAQGPYVPDYLPLAPPFLPYAPLNNGQPAGSPVSDLGTMETLRFLEREPHEQGLLAEPYRGPGLFVLWASVQQTNPTTRPPLVLNAPADPGALEPEDRFVLAVPNVVYRKLGGLLRADMVGVSCLDALYQRAVRGEIPSRFLALGKVLP